MTTTNHVTTTSNTLRHVTMYIYMYLEKVRTEFKIILAEIQISKLCYILLYKLIESKLYTAKYIFVLAGKCSGFVWTIKQVDPSSRICCFIVHR